MEGSTVNAMLTMPNYLRVALVLVIATMILAVIPASRRWLVNVWMQIGGWIDARLLRKHHQDLVVRAVTRRISGITLRTEAIFSRWLQQRRAWFSWLGARYNRAMRLWDEARRELAAQELAAQTAPAESDVPQFLPLGRGSYYLVQTILGCGEGVLTYLAFQLWHLSPLWLLVIVALLAVIGAGLGHLIGQAMYRRRVRHAIAIGCIGVLYCALLGGMRFAWLATHAENGGGSFINCVSAFGWPTVCLALGVVVGSQLRYLTALAQARLNEMHAEHECDRLHQRGAGAVKALRDAMNARKAHKTTSIDAYHRGFSFGSARDPVAFPEQAVTVPDGEVDALWPPVPSAPPAPSPASTSARRNGSFATTGRG